MITGDVPRPEQGAGKDEWRTWARQTRQQLHSLEASRELARLLADWPPFRFARVVLTYLPFRTEPDLGDLLQLSGHRYVTTRTPPAPAELTIHDLDPLELEQHPYGFRQPLATAEPVDPRQIDLALIPGLVFDQQGGRLGYGAGNYDRLLPALRADIPLVGVTYDGLVIRELPTEPLDVTMTHLLTGKGVTQLSG